MSNRLVRILIASAAGLALAAGVAWLQTRHLGDPSSSAATIGGPFQLVDQTGRTVTDADFRGRFMLVYFGYTYCPDVCPTELQGMATALDRLGPAGERVQLLFITVDPERDTVAHLADYVALFHPRLIGLTGTPGQIAQVARAYRVYFAKAPGRDPDSPYLMDHSAFVYLIGPDGRFVTAFAAGTAPDRIASEIRNRF